MTRLLRLDPSGVLGLRYLLNIDLENALSVKLNLRICRDYLGVLVRKAEFAGSKPAELLRFEEELGKWEAVMQRATENRSDGESIKLEVEELETRRMYIRRELEAKGWVQRRVLVPGERGYF